MHALVNDYGSKAGLVDLEHLHKYSKQLSKCHQIVQLLFGMHVFIQFALDIAVVVLIVNSYLLSGKDAYNKLADETEGSLNFVWLVFQTTEPGQENGIMMAHYLLFISMAVNTTWLCSAYIFYKLTLIPCEVTNNCGLSARCLKIMTSLILVLNPWMKTRYGYHFSMYYMVNKLIHFILLILPIFNHLKPGTSINIQFAHCIFHSIGTNVTFRHPGYCIHSSMA